jgi:hypothetical protein
VKKLTNSEIAEGYRRLACLLEANPDMAQPYEGTGGALLFISHKKAEFAATIRAFGEGEKGSQEDELTFVPKFPLRIKVIGLKYGICERMEVISLIPEKVIPATEETIIPAHEETKVEYVCDHAFLRVQADPAPVEG